MLIIRKEERNCINARIKLPVTIMLLDYESGSGTKFDTPIVSSTIAINPPGFQEKAFPADRLIRIQI